MNDLQIPDDRDAWGVAVSAVRDGIAPAVAAAALVARMTEDERVWCLDGDLPFWASITDLGTGGYHRRPFPAAAVDRLGVPGFAFSDGPRGCVIGGATAFPVTMARGASWDVELEERIGEVIGTELRAVGADLFGGVCVNLLRHPAWGRAQETYGEDPHHVGELGAALTRGIQRHVMATVKHFAVNSMENARFKIDVSVEDDVLHEVYLPHFKRIVDEGVACVMSAYNLVNGEQCGQSPALLRDVLRGEWGFEGFVISDWIYGMRDAGASLTAGLDVEMPAQMMRWQQLDAALAAGECTRGDIDAAVTRTMGAMLRHAATDGAAAPRPRLDVLGAPAHRALARDAAAKSIVLLRNEQVDGTPLLPLDPASLITVAVVGRLADERNLGDGGSSDVMSAGVVTPLAGLRAGLEPAGVTIVTSDPGAASAAVAAERSDVAVVVVGYTRADEGEYIGVAGTEHLSHLFPPADDEALAEAFTARIAADPGPEVPAEAVPASGERGFSTGGDRRDLRLLADDEAVIAAVAATGTPTIVVIVSGSAVLMEAWRHDVDAIVQLWYPGVEGGHALADMITGRIDVRGRLPFAIPTAAAHLTDFDPDADAVDYDRWHGHWRLARDGNPAAYPFGFGLAYTDFSLRDASVLADGDELVVEVTVANTGSRDGNDVVQIYGGRPADSTRPARRLVGFARVDVAAGATAVVSLRVPRERFAVRADGRWTQPDGAIELAVARHSEDADAIVVIVEDR